MKKITIALIMVISLIAPIQTMAESVTQNGTIIEPLEQNIEQIIDEITSEPRPINFISSSYDFPSASSYVRIN